MRLPLLAVLLVPLALTGCGDDDPTAAPRPSASPAPIASSATVPLPSPDLARRRLTGDGLDLPGGVVSFGDPLSEVQPVLLAALGEPTKDTGSIDPFSEYGTCPQPDLRVLEYGGGALQLFFRTPAGGSEMALAAWVLTDGADQPRASALVGDTATFDFGPGTTLPALQEGLGEALSLTDDELVGPAFRVQDQSSGFSGQLSSTGPDGVVETVQAGESCGE